MEASRRLAIALLFAALISSTVSGFFPAALAQDAEDQGLTFDTAQPFYKPGETVAFTGEGYNPAGQYNVTVNGDEIGPFGATEGGVLTGANWDSSAAPTGTYEATAYNVTDPEQHEFLADAHFGLWGTDKDQYFLPDTVVISGGGVMQGDTVDITIENETGHLWWSYSQAAGGLGEFSASWSLPLDVTNGTHTAYISFSATFDGEDFAGPLQTSFKVNSTEEGRQQWKLEDIESDLEGKYEELEEAVEHEGVRNSFTSKIDVVTKLFLKALERAGMGKKSAQNVLKAAQNVLKAFVNHVKAQNGTQPGKKVNSEWTDALISNAEGLIDKLEDTKGWIDSLSDEPSEDDGDLDGVDGDQSPEPEGVPEPNLLDDDDVDPDENDRKGPPEDKGKGNGKGKDKDKGNGKGKGRGGQKGKGKGNRRG